MPAADGQNFLLIAEIPDDAQDLYWGGETHEQMLREVQRLLDDGYYSVRVVDLRTGRAAMASKEPPPLPVYRLPRDWIPVYQGAKEEPEAEPEAASRTAWWTVRYNMKGVLKEIAREEKGQAYRPRWQDVVAALLCCLGAGRR